MLTQLEAMSDPAASADDRRRARYWRARTLEQLGEEEQATALMTSLATNESCTYYGLLARAQLAEREGGAAAVFEADAVPARIWPLEAGVLMADRRFREAFGLLRLERPEASGALRAVERRLQGTEVLRTLFHLLATAKLSRSAGVAARDYLRGGFSVASAQEARLLHEAAYPHTFRPWVLRESKKGRVDPDLMQALIREESGFNPRARSATGALGLAQLMPETAAMVGRSIKMAASTRSLLDPSRNIRLGARYLGQLHRRFDGNAALAVASYNAGPGAVRRWLNRAPPDLELDEWVEEIPVEETRSYVKHVLGGYGAYRFLYEDARPELKLALKLDR